MASLGAIFSRMPDAVFAIDDACRIVYRNEAFADIFEHRLSGPSGRRCHDVLCGRTLEGEKFCGPDCPVGRNLLQGQPVGNFELAVPRDDGPSLWLSVGAIPARGVFDNVGAIFTLRPIRMAGLSPRPLHDAPPDRSTALTHRERQVLDLLAGGHSAKSLARVLQIRHATARNHIQHIYEKLGVHNRAQAVSYAWRRQPH